MSLLLHSRWVPAMPTPTPDTETAKGARILETWCATSVNEYTTRLIIRFVVTNPSPSRKYGL